MRSNDCRQKERGRRKEWITDTSKIKPAKLGGRTDTRTTMEKKNHSGPSVILPEY